jgi:hypothetical protein
MKHEVVATIIAKAVSIEEPKWTMVMAKNMC